MDEASCDCEPRGLTRRQVLGGLATLGATVGLQAVGANRYAFAASAAPTDLLVFVALRGGMDGLSVVAPVGDRHYLKERGPLAVTAREGLRIDRTFAFHPRMAPLLPMWRAGELAVVHAVGDAEGTRSHFRSQDAMDRGVLSSSSTATGWIDRHLQLRGASSADFPAVAIGGSVPTSLTGPASDLALRTVSDFRLQVSPRSAARYEKTLAALHAGVGGAPADAARGTLGALRRLRPVQDRPYKPAAGVTYPGSSLGRSLQEVARLAKAKVGLTVACVEYGGWDLHSGMGGPQRGQMVNQVDALASALAAFRKDMGPAMRTTTVVAMTEFGRRLARNGSGGLDHGWGGVMLLLGGGIRGGRVHGRWPGLAPAQLEQGDLRVTTDYRDVLAEVVARRLGNGRYAEVFPGHRTAFRGVAVQR